MWFWVHFLWLQSCRTRSSPVGSHVPHTAVHCHPELCWYNCLGGCTVNSSLKISLQKPQVLSFPWPFYRAVLQFYWHTSERDKLQFKIRSLWENWAGNIFNLLPNQIKGTWNHALKSWPHRYSSSSSTKLKSTYSQLLITVAAALSICQAAWSLRSASWSRLQRYK